MNILKVFNLGFQCFLKRYYLKYSKQYLLCHSKNNLLSICYLLARQFFLSTLHMWIHFNPLKLPLKLSFIILILEVREQAQKISIIEQVVILKKYFLNRM